MKLVWNAIVKNEVAIIGRCVKSLLPHIDGAVIVDTGSSDNTVALLQHLFDAAGKPIEIQHAMFVNFELARNMALHCARNSRLQWDYLLLCDADMEMKVTRPDWLQGLTGESYDLKQTAGSLGYYNRRLVSRHATGCYRGVTHEYLDAGSVGRLDGAEFIDHADGANRPEKISRDIALLKQALETEKDPGLIQRYHFYLAGSYFDSGEWYNASVHYGIRTRLGGFDEEVWYAQLRYALCLQNMGAYAGFVEAMLQAYRLRPHRVESLYHLARHFRERGDNYSSVLFSQAGLVVPYPRDDLLFIDNYVYDTGLKEEFVICAYYDPVRRQRGQWVCDQLVLKGSEQARINQYWYLQPLIEHLPSFKPVRIPFVAGDGYVAMNPSVINQDGKPLVLVRTVNYTINARGEYEIRGPGHSCNHTNPIRTVNYLVRLDDRLDFVGSDEIKLPVDWPEPKFPLVRGFEDSRLVQWQKQLYTLSTVRELTTEGWCEQCLAPIACELGQTFRYGAWLKIQPSHEAMQLHQKNWMPWVRGEELFFVYRLGTLLDSAGRMAFQHTPDFDASRISGGSQVIEVEGLPMAIVHEARQISGQSTRYYVHRFVVFSHDGRPLRISPPFCFHDRQIEFAAGLAYFPDKRQLMISYGVRDCEAWLAVLDVDEVLAFVAEERS